MPAMAAGDGGLPLASPTPHCPHCTSPHLHALAALQELREIVASEGYAMTALTLGRYRTDLVATIDHYLKDCTA